MRLSRLCRPAAVLLCASLLFVPAPGTAAPARSPVPVSGRVLGPGGEPLRGARAALVPVVTVAEDSRLGLEGKAGPEPVALGSTGADGTFRLEAPDTGMWRVRVEASGFVPREIDLVPLVDEIELPEVELAPDARLQVRVTGPDGSPLAGARVRVSQEMDLSSMSMDAWSVPVRIARTDAAGVAVLPRADGERLLVEAGAEGLPVAVVEEVQSGSAALRLPAGTSRQIRVLEAAGRKPVAGVSVHVGEHIWPAGRTSGDGLFTVPMVSGRKEELLLMADDGRFLQATLEPPAKERKEPETLHLPGLESVTGRVVSAADGRPIAGALVWNLDPGAFQRTGADGAYRINIVSDFPNAIQAAAPGFLPGQPEVSGSGLERGPTMALAPALSAGGVVVDEKGAPVAGVEVGVGTHSPFSEGLARTGPAGRFRIGGLATGIPYELRFSKPGFAPATAELPPLEAGQPAPDLRVVLRQGRTGLGRVVNRAEQPVAGAEIALRPSGGEELPFEMEMEAGGSETVTGADGRFEIRDLPAGTFELSVRGRGYAPLHVPGLAVPEGAGRTDLGTVILAPGIALEGHVVDAQGQPIAGAEVSLLDGSDPRTAFLALEGSPTAVTGADGFFRIEDRREGETIALLAGRTGYAPSGIPGVQIPPERPVRIVLSPASALEGRVVDQEGEPVGGAIVIAFPADLLTGTMGRTAQPGNALADAEGRFRIEGLAPGPIELRAMALGRQEAVLKNLEIRPGQDLTGLEVVLAAGAVIQGRVLSPDGGPVVGATLHLTDVETFFDATSDGDGHYRLEGVPPGIRTVLADHDSYRPAQRQIEVRAGTNALDITFEGGGATQVSGRVVGPDGEPVANARVYLGQDFGYTGNLPSGVSGPDGSFTLSGVEDGAYRLFAGKAGFARSREGRLVVVEGASVSGLEVRLAPGGSIAGRILGLELPELARVQVQAGHDGPVGQVRPDGTYRIDHVEPGEVEVVASLSGGARQAEGMVVLEPGAAEARLDLDFRKGFVLTGRVLVNGEPAQGEQLLLLKTVGLSSSRWGETDHEGRFRFEGLEAGAYHLDLAHRSGTPEEEIEISGDRDILIELRTASISGRILDAAGRRPLPNATVAITPAETPADADGETSLIDATTDSRGVFVLRNVAEGRWKLEASLAGYAPAATEVRTVGGTPVEGVELALQAADGLTLDLQLRSGSLPAAVNVWVLDSMDRTVSVASHPIEADGRVRITNLDPGAWELLLDVAGSPLLAVPVTVPGHSRAVLPQPSGLELLVIPLVNEGKRGRVRLTDAGGRPFRVPTAGGVQSDFVLEAGAGKFDRIPAGDWRITVTTDDGRAWTRNVVFPPGTPAQVVLDEP